MMPFGDSPPDPDLLMTLTLHFVTRHPGTYHSHAALRTRITHWIENECRMDLSWFRAERDMEDVVERVLGVGGVVVVDTPDFGHGISRGVMRKVQGEKEEVAMQDEKK